MSYDDNPFEEGNTSTTTKNPFDDTEDTTPSFTPSSTSRSSTLRTSPPPQHTPPVQTTANFDTGNDGLRAKEEEIRRREEDLKRREKQLDALERDINAGIVTKRKNWPFFKPIFYQDISEEIPTEQQFLVKVAYYLWAVTAGVWAFNFGVTLGFLIVTGEGPAVAGMILSIVYFCFFVPISFMGFRLLYNGAKKLKSSYYLAYMCFKWFEFAVMVWQIIGLAGWGGGGFFLMIYCFEHGHKAMGGVALALTVLWIFIFIVHFYLFIHARVFYKKVGGYAAAKKQGAAYLGQKAAENPDVVVSVASATASTAASGAAYGASAYNRA